MTTSASADPPPASGQHLAASLTTDVATLDRELTEIDMLVGQAKRRVGPPRAEARPARREAGRDRPEGEPDRGCRRLDAARHAHAARRPHGGAGRRPRGEATSPRPPPRRDRGDRGRDRRPARHAGGGRPRGRREPAVDVARRDERPGGPAARHLAGDARRTGAVPHEHRAPGGHRRAPRSAGTPTGAKGELRLLVSMVQHTLEATKSFIFDVRPMVLDDLGVVPTLRRMTRDRGRKAKVPVEFESLGQERRLPMDLESTIFRILDDALSAYLAHVARAGPGPARLDGSSSRRGSSRSARRSSRATSRCPRCPRTRPTPSGR